MTTIHPIILSGGMGTRLWPMSRVRQPKQFQPVNGDGGASFFQTTVLRHRGPQFADPVLVASATEADLLDRQMREIEIEGRFVGEPIGRNTGPAVLSAALQLAQDDPGALMLVLPSDHKIEGDLNGIVTDMAPAAAEGRIVLFGIVPRSPETGFGYITGGSAVPGHDGLHEVDSFIEKPAATLAESLISEGRTFWASGISMMRADVLIEEFARFAPDTLAAVRAALAAATSTPTGVVLDETAFAKAENEPTERLIFERSERVSVVPTDVDWNDVGAWTAVHSIGDKSEAGNVETGEVVCIETSNSLIRAGSKLVTVIGLEDVIIVDTADALLVTNHANAQKVKEAVSRLKADGRVEVVQHAEMAAAEVAASVEAEAEATKAAPVSKGSESAVHEHVLHEGEEMTMTADAPGGTMLAVADGRARFNGSIPETHRETGAHLTLSAGEQVCVSNPSAAPLRLVAVNLPRPEAADQADRAAEQARAFA